HAHALGQLCVDLLEPGGEPRMPVAEIVLAWIVRSVGEPEAEDRGADAAGDLDALAAVVECPCTHLLVRVAQAPEPVVVVAERVRVDRADPESALGCVLRQSGPVVDAVPGDVESDGRAAPGQAVDECGVVDPLPDGPGGPRPRIDVE